jgi:hypothetical protein
MAARIVESHEVEYWQKLSLSADWQPMVICLTNDQQISWYRREVGSVTQASTIVLHVEKSVHMSLFVASLNVHLPFQDKNYSRRIGSLSWMQKQYIKLSMMDSLRAYFRSCHKQIVTTTSNYKSSVFRRFPVSSASRRLQAGSIVYCSIGSKKPPPARNEIFPFSDI